MHKLENNNKKRQNERLLQSSMRLVLKFCILHPFLEPYHCWLRPQILNARKVGDQVVIGVPGFPQLREARLLHSSVGSTGHRQQVPVASLRGLQFACLSVRDWRNWHPLNDPENSGIASPKRISKTKQKTMDIPRFQTNHTQNKLLLIINKQNELNFNDNLTKHEWSNWGTGLWICKCVSFWLKAWLIFTGHQLLPYPGGTSWLRFPLFTSVDSETRFEQTYFSLYIRTQHLQTTWICRFQRKNKTCNHVRPFTQQKKTMSVPRCTTQKTTAWGRWYLRATHWSRRRWPLGSKVVPVLVEPNQPKEYKYHGCFEFRYVSRLWRYQTGQSWEDLDDISVVLWCNWKQDAKLLKLRSQLLTGTL